jgi:hypothetical protein
MGMLITRKGAGTAISAVRSQATRAVQGGACAGSAQIHLPSPTAGVGKGAYREIPGIVLETELAFLLRRNAPALRLSAKGK